VRAEARRAICAVYGVPPAIAGAWEAANYATVQEQRLSMYQDEIIPLSGYLAGVINSELLPEFDANLSFRFKIEDLPIMQPDANMEATRIVELVRAGIITVEAGAKELGYTEEEIGEGPQTFGGFGGGPFSKKEEEEEEKSSPLKTDLEKWCRKAMKRVQAGNSALCEFESEHIPLALGEAISGALEEATTKDEVKAIFHSVFDYEHMPYTKERDVNQEQVNQILNKLESLKDSIILSAATQQSTKISTGNPIVEIKADNFVQEPPVINIPEQKPPEVIVNVPEINPKFKIEIPEMKAPHIVVNVPPQEPPTIINKIDIPKQTGSKRKVKRDKRGFIDSIEEETTWDE